MKRTYKFGRIIHALSDDEKALFKNEEVKSLDLLNKKLNLIIDILTEIEDEEIIDSREVKGIEVQDNSAFSTDSMQGEMIVESVLKTTELEQSINSIGQGVVEIILNQERGSI